MTAHEHISAAKASVDGSEMPPVGELDDDVPAAVGVLCQAESAEIGISGASTDPFDATLVLSGTDPQGLEVAVWMRLTPTTIYQITEQLEEVLVAQQQSLGVSGHNPADQDVDSGATEPGDADPGEGRVKRFFDPMGIRHMRDRSPRSTVILGAAIASLVVLAFVLQLVR